MQCDLTVLPSCHYHFSTTLDVPFNCEQDKPIHPQVAFVRYFATAMSEVTNVLASPSFFPWFPLPCGFFVHITHWNIPVLLFAETKRGSQSRAVAGTWPQVRSLLPLSWVLFAFTQWSGHSTGELGTRLTHGAYSESLGHRLNTKEPGSPALAFLNRVPVPTS